LQQWLIRKWNPANGPHLAGFSVNTHIINKKVCIITEEGLDVLEKVPAQDKKINEKKGASRSVRGDLLSYCEDMKKSMVRQLEKHFLYDTFLDTVRETIKITLLHNVIHVKTLFPHRSKRISMTLPGCCIESHNEPSGLKNTGV